MGEKCWLAVAIRDSHFVYVYSLVRADVSQGDIYIATYLFTHSVVIKQSVHKDNAISRAESTKRKARGLKPVLVVTDTVYIIKPNSTNLLMRIKTEELPSYCRFDLTSLPWSLQ